MLASSDPFYRDTVQLPVEHWKLVAYRLNEQVGSKCFVLSQDFDDVKAAVPDFLNQFDTYLVALDVLEERTGLIFDSLREHATDELLRPPTGRLVVTDPEQVGW